MISDYKAVSKETIAAAGIKSLGKGAVNAHPMLQCEGSPSCGRWVLHHWDHDAIDHIKMEKVRHYACSRCGTTRVWGLEEFGGNYKGILRNRRSAGLAVGDLYRRA